MRTANTRRLNREASTLSVRKFAGREGRETGRMDVSLLSTRSRRKARVPAHSRWHHGTIPDRNRGPEGSGRASAFGQQRKTSGGKSHVRSGHRTISKGGAAGEILHADQLQIAFEKVDSTEVGRPSAHRNSHFGSRALVEVFAIGTKDQSQPENPYACVF